MTKKARRDFVLQKVQPALLGLMDGAVSTLAPIFAAAGLSQKPLNAFFVGLAASLGAGISMGLAEGLSDDGTVTAAADRSFAAPSPALRRRSVGCCTRSPS
jgi:erythrin-vacuolar iron transport family protein